MVNATTTPPDPSQPQASWVWGLMPIWFYYGRVVLFWLGMMEPLPLPSFLLLPPPTSSSSSSSPPGGVVPSSSTSFWPFLCLSRCCRRTNTSSSAATTRTRRSVVTLHGWWIMFCNFAQHASTWLGLFFMARQWDYNTAAARQQQQLDHPDSHDDDMDIENDDSDINRRLVHSWFLVSIPFYLAIFFRCYCTRVALARLRHVQSKMVSRQQMMQQQQQQQQTLNSSSGSGLPEGYIVVTSKHERPRRSAADSINNDNNNNNTAEQHKLLVQTSPEYRQVDYTVLVLKRAALQLAILGSSFIALVTLKVDAATNPAWEAIGFGTVFLPIWIHFICRSIFSFYCRSPKYQQQEQHHSTAATTAAAGTAGATTTSSNRRRSRKPRHNKSSTNTHTRNASVLDTPHTTREPIILQFNANDDDDASSTEAVAAVEEFKNRPIMSGVTTKSLGVGESTSVGIVELLAPDLAHTRVPKEGVASSASSRNSIEEEDDDDEDDPKTATTSVSILWQKDQKVEPWQLYDDDDEDDDVATKESSTKESPHLFDVETGLNIDEASIEPYQEEKDAESAGESEPMEYFDAVEEIPDETTITVKTTIDLAGVAKYEMANKRSDAVVERPSTPEDNAHVDEEFERWQSVYENREVRTTGTPCPVPCSAFFQLLVCNLVVAKLNMDYGNDDPDNAGFNAFYIILIPLLVALFACCCLIPVFCCCHLLHPPTAESSDAIANNNVPTALEAAQISTTDGNVMEFDASGLDESPMHAGPGLYQRMAFSTHIDIVRNDFDLQQCSQVCAMALDVTAEDAKVWLVLHGNSGNEVTFWKQITMFADDVDCPRVNNDEQCFEGLKPMDQEWLTLLRVNLQAHFDKTQFQEELDAIVPLDVEGDDAIASDDELGESRAEAGIECLVCCESFKISDTVHCEGDPIHFFCRPCFHRYVTETVDSGDIAGLPCAHVECTSTFATTVVRENLSTWEVLRMQDREADRNTRVALAAKAVLKCPCGTIGIVSDQDIGDGCITCPGTGCGVQYCALCGNTWHPDTNCPPTKKMLQYVLKNTMPCPNCHTPLVKNGGCDHMHCAPPGGCGHHFSYTTGKPMTVDGRRLRGLYNT